MTQETPENTDDKPGLPIVQFLGSEHPADNLNVLCSITEFLNDAAIAIGYAPDGFFHKDTANGMSYILQIISHDLKVIAENLPFDIQARKRKK